MTEVLSRASLLRGRLRGGPPPLRPPWALPEPLFLDRCTRCDDCRRTCPEGIIVRGSGGFPKIDFRLGECSFCGRCLEACGAKALAAERARPWTAKAAVGAACLAKKGVVCRSCEDVCEPRAIRFEIGRVASPNVEAALCTGCGACVTACPVDAIAVAAEEQATYEVLT